MEGKQLVLAVVLVLLPLSIFCDVRNTRTAGNSRLKKRAQSCSDLTIGEKDSCHDKLLAPVEQFSPEGTKYSPRKMAYTRKLYDGVYVAGQLTARQIKYAADSGIKTIVSIFDNDGQDGLSKEEERHIVEDLAGMKFLQVLPKGMDWFSEDAVAKMTDIWPQIEFPVLLHCQRAVSVTYLTLLYYVNQTRHVPHFHPHVTIQRFYEITRLHGLDFVGKYDNSIPTVEAITGRHIPHSAHAPNVSLTDWTDYWEAMPVYYNWFVSGQINTNDLTRIINTGFDTIVNVRAGVTRNGKPSQESVELINIASGTPTYATDSQYARQSKQGLENSIVDPAKPNTYISPSSKVNYEDMNSEEFGDAIGYNETKEKLAVENLPVDYELMPIRK